MLLVTGSEGLIGRHLCKSFESAGVAYRRFDLARSEQEDVTKIESVENAMDGVSGIVHLAAVSRVVWGQQDPARCISTNVVALKHLLEIAGAQKSKPWIIFGSSREVYGQAERFPVNEDCPFRPMNVYADTKVAGERLIGRARDTGLVANICRFSGVFGCVDDHPDRVVPAFAATAARGGELRIDGSSHVFDFTHIGDTVRGLHKLVEATASGERLPPIHFVSGEGTTLGGLAELAAAHARKPVTFTEAPPRSFDISGFIGCPERAAHLLGWRVATRLSDTFPALITAMARKWDAIALD